MHLIQVIHYISYNFYSKFQMNFKLPTIDKSKPQQQEQEYNFVNTKQRRKTKDLVTPPGLAVDDLKKKIEEQKREIETRNNAIMALQRNFESMAALLKTEKIENSSLKQEMEKYKKMAEENGKRATDFHERNIQLGNDLKKAQLDKAQLNEEIRSLNKTAEQAESHLKTIESLTKQNKKLETQLSEIAAEKQQLMAELRKFKDIERERRQYQQKISELRQEVRVLSTEKDGLLMKIEQMKEAVRIAEVNLKNSENEKQNLRKKNLDQKNRQLESNGEISKLKNKIYSLEEQLIKVRTEAENKNVIIMMKMKTEEELKGTMVDLKMKLGKHQGDLFQKTSDIDELNRRVADADEKVRNLTNELKDEKKRNDTLNREISVGADKDKELKELMDELEEAKENNHNLDIKLHQVSEEYGLVLDKYEQYFSELDSCSPAKVITLNQYNKMRNAILTLENNIGDNMSQAEDLNKKLRMQQNQLIDLLKKLEKYEHSEKQLSDLLSKEKSMLQRLAIDKKQRQEEINKQKQKNKLLWSDNKKLKQQEEKLIEEIETQKQQLKIKSQKDLQKLEQEKDAEIRQKERILKEEYEKQFEMLRSSNNSNNDEVSKILKKKGEIIKGLEEKLAKVTQEVEFYKNRYKELEGVSSRSDKKLKQMERTYNQNTQAQKEAQEQLQNKYASLQRQHKSCSQNIQALASRLSSLEQFKKQNASIADQNKSIKQKLKMFESQNKVMKKKLQGFQSEDIVKKRDSLNNKIQLLLKSVSDLSESLQSIKNHISCSHCCELPTETVKLIPCGHVFCKKCKAGYEDVCDECKKSGNVVPDKQHDQTVTKLNYMQMILVSVKEDTAVLSKL